MSQVFYTESEMHMLVAEAKSKGREEALAGKLNLQEKDVKWIVNDLAELGVRIGNQCFFLYKGESLVYKAEDRKIRPVFKREFGECCKPLNRDNPNLPGTVDLEDSNKWEDMPPQTL